MMSPRSITALHALLSGVAILALAAATPKAMFAVTPVSGGSIGGSPVLINSSPGNQTYPHVSGDLGAYTDESGAFGSLIRYYDFFAGAPGAISTPLGSTDQLSDVNGNHIAFARQTGLSRSCKVFDVTTLSTVQIGPDNSGAFATAVGSDTVAFVSLDDIKVGRISNPSGPLANLSASAALDFSPAVSPNGNAVVWQACTGGSCSILKSTFNGTSWSSSIVVANAPAVNTSPDTDGTSIAYDSDRAGSVDGSDIYLQALSGGADTQLSLAGAQRNPSISGGVIAFESTVVGAFSADLFIYEISSNRLFQLTDTASLDEQLNDVTVLADGSIRVVWAAHPDYSSDSDVIAQTFSLPAEPPLPDPEDTTPPEVTIAAPADGALYTKDQVVAADYACDDEPGGSGLASCDGPVAAGDPIDTASVGGHLFAVTGSDNAGNEVTLEHGYGVVFSVSSFASPVDDLAVLNSVKAGQSVPVRFSLGGDQGLAIFGPGYPKSQRVLCDSSAPVDGIEETLTAGASSLAYDAASDLYSYVWKTDKTWAGSCRQLVLALVDGTFRRANFMFR
jgi:hypothetical protein